MMKKYIVFFLLYHMFNTVLAKEYTISNVDELNKLTLVAGDRVILKAGIWKDQTLVCKGVGTMEQPIMFSGAENGATVISQGSSIRIEGTYLQIQKIKFQEPDIPKGSIVSFSKASRHCRFTDNIFVHEQLGFPEKAKFFHWISMYGQYNRIDHCYFKGKVNRGCTIAAEASEHPSYNRIDHNFFDHRPELGQNGGESIRIGNWNTSMFSSKITVEENIFQNCNGEIEIISNKSIDNIIRNNLFFESKGTITLRHGKRATVEGNFFIGDGSPYFGGIRITGEGHHIFNNYFYKIIGKDVHAPISFRNAWENPPLHGYDEVKDCFVYSNTFVNCGTVFYIGVNKDEKSIVAPIDSKIYNNVLYQAERALQIIEPRFQFDIQNNLMSSHRGETYKGFIKNNLKGKSVSGITQVIIPKRYKGQNLAGAYVQNMGVQPLNENQENVLRGKDIGPTWYSFIFKFK